MEEKASQWKYTVDLLYVIQAGLSMEQRLQKYVGGGLVCSQQYSLDAMLPMKPLAIPSKYGDTMNC